MARSCHAGGGKTLKTCTAGSIIGQGITFKILTDQAGQIFYISPPLPGSTHDITAIRNTGLFGHMQPWHITADIRLRGFRMRHTLEKKTRETLTGMAETIQQRNQPDPLCGRTIHRPPKNLADTIYPQQAPPTHNHPGNQCDTKDNVLPITSWTLFPQQLDKLPLFHISYTQLSVVFFTLICAANIRPLKTLSFSYRF